MKTSANTAAAAQTGAVKRVITTTDDSVAARKQKVVSKQVSTGKPSEESLHVSPLVDSFTR